MAIGGGREGYGRGDALAIIFFSPSLFPSSPFFFSFFFSSSLFLSVKRDGKCLREKEEEEKKVFLEGNIPSIYPPTFFGSFSKEGAL